MICTQCKTRIPDDSKFCKECGINIGNTASSEDVEISLGNLKTLLGKPKGTASDGNRKYTDIDSKSRVKYKVLLKILTGKLKGRKYSAEEPLAICLGRSDKCEISLSTDIEPGISRLHCSFDINPPLVTIMDLGSKNGTVVNDEQLKPKIKYELRAGDLLRFGETVISMEIIEMRKVSADNIITKFLEKHK